MPTVRVTVGDKSRPNPLKHFHMENETGEPSPIDDQLREAAIRIRDLEAKVEVNVAVEKELHAEKKRLRETVVRTNDLESEINDLKRRLADRQRELTAAREEIAELRQRNIRLESDNE